MTVFMASIVIGSVTPLVYAREKRWRVGSDWKPLLFTLYASIVVGSLIIDVATALALQSIPRLAPACMGSVTIGAYGPIDGLVTAPPLGLLAGYIVRNSPPLNTPASASMHGLSNDRSLRTNRRTSHRTTIGTTGWVYRVRFNKD